MEQLAPILRRTLVLVAHHDDETIACGTLLRRIESPVVAFATDGAPCSELFWRRWGSRAAYADVRRREALEAMKIAGVECVEFADGIPDQELHRNLETAYRWLQGVTTRFHVDAILTLAYEGGHPDHDSCSVLAAALGTELNVPVWEAPLYHRKYGVFTTREFLDSTGGEIRLELSAEEVRIKRTMADAYRSQGETITQFGFASEVFRAQHRYDYTRAPHDGPANYQAWGWPYSPQELCAAFVCFIEAQVNGSAA